VLEPEDPDYRKYGPLLVFAIVLALLFWAVAAYRLGGR
jgi:hypothetical protein